ncbi:TrmH family RNA methyltransferase [Gordonia sputi]
MSEPVSAPPLAASTPSLAVDVIDIDDPTDLRVDDFRDLNSVDRRPDLPTLPGGRPGKGLVIAEGVLVAQRMIASRFTPHAFLGVDKRLGELADDLRNPSLSGVPFYRASAEVMAEIVGFHLNRGVLGVARRPAALEVDDALANATTIAVLEGVNDHENIGSIFRNAAGLGVDAVLFGAGCADPLYRRCVRVSMGHVLLVPHARFDDWRGALDLLADHGFTTVALTPRESAVPLADAVSADKVAVLVGAEGPGLSETAIRGSHVAARIPMSRGTDSLNVATAAAIAFYERVRSGTIDR